MQVGEVLGLPSAAAAYFECKRVAQRKHNGRRCGGCEVEGAGLDRDAGIEEDVARLREGRGAAAADSDELCVEALERWEQAQQFFSLSAVRERQDDVA